MMQDQALRDVSAALRTPAAVEFVRSSVKAGYRQFFATVHDEVFPMVDGAFDQLVWSERDGLELARLVSVAPDQLEHPFRKADRSFWFNQLYHRYNSHAKPATYLEQLQAILPGNKVL